MAKKKKIIRSNEERLIRVWDIEQVKDLMSRRTVYETNGEHQKELDELWVQVPENQATASFGRNWGFYVGMDEIKRYYVDQYADQVSAELQAIGKPDEAPGYGRFLYHPLSTPNVNLAEDGKPPRAPGTPSARTAIPLRTARTATGTARRSARTSSRSPAAGRSGTWCSPMISR